MRAIAPWRSAAPCDEPVTSTYGAAPVFVPSLTCGDSSRWEKPAIADPGVPLFAQSLIVTAAVTLQLTVVPFDEQLTQTLKHTWPTPNGLTAATDPSRSANGRRSKPELAELAWADLARRHHAPTIRAKLTAA